MKNDNRVLWTFLAKLLVALPACYGLWYWAVSLSGPAVWISARLLELLYPSVFAGIIPHGDDWIFATRLQDGGNAAAENTGIGIVVSPRQFDFGWPLLLALLTASPGSDRLTNIVIGSAGMVAVACWGITFYVLKALSFNFSDVFLPVSGLHGWQLEAIALSYQSGTIILPAFSPVLIWALLDRSGITLLAGLDLSRANETVHNGRQR